MGCKMVDKKKKAEDKFKGFKKYYVNGKEVIDLTSINNYHEPIKIRAFDLERQQIYGNKSSSTKLM